MAGCLYFIQYMKTTIVKMTNQNPWNFPEKINSICGFLYGPLYDKSCTQLTEETKENTIERAKIQSTLLQVSKEDRIGVDNYILLLVLYSV